MKHKKQVIIKKPKCSCCGKDVPIAQSYSGNGIIISLCRDCNSCGKCGAAVDVIKRFIPVKRGLGYEWQLAGAEPLCQEHYNEAKKAELKLADVIGKLPMVI